MDSERTQGKARDTKGKPESKGAQGNVVNAREKKEKKTKKNSVLLLSHYHYPVSANSGGPSLPVLSLSHYHYLVSAKSGWLKFTGVDR